MRISNTNYKNISFDKARSRYRIEMRIGKFPRTARVKDLESAIIIRNEWLIERNILNAELAAEKIKSEHIYELTRLRPTHAHSPLPHPTHRS
jgi:hypothetical protein